MDPLVYPFMSKMVSQLEYRYTPPNLSLSLSTMGAFDQRELQENGDILRAPIIPLLTLLVNGKPHGKGKSKNSFVPSHDGMGVLRSDSWLYISYYGGGGEVRVHQMKWWGGVRMGSEEIGRGEIERRNWEGYNFFEM